MTACATPAKTYTVLNRRIACMLMTKLSGAAATGEPGETTAISSGRLGKEDGSGSGTGTVSLAAARMARPTAQR